MKFYKFLFLLLVFSFSTITVFAFPGVELTVPNTSGEFVYYKDYSFQSESYLGVIYYDETTYGFRHYSPAKNDKKNPTPEMDISVFFTINPSEKAENSLKFFVGEQRIPNMPRSKEETDIVNYLHSIAYELFPKRIKAGLISEPKKFDENFFQFGGDVTVTYDPIIPVFNLKSIYSKNGKKNLEIITAGRLSSSEDSSFSGFKGIADISTDTSAKLKIKKAKESVQQIKYDNGYIELNLDENWASGAENFWLYGNSAVLLLVSLNNENIPPRNFLLRNFMLGTDNNYSDWTKTVIKEEGNKISLQQTYFNSSTGSFSKDFKTLNTKSNTLMTMTVYSKAYTANKKYFDSIINTYKSE